MRLNAFTKKTKKTSKGQEITQIKKKMNKRVTRSNLKALDNVGY